MIFPTFKNEIECLKNNFSYVAGCDEVGVGPLAGPVVAAACILDPQSISGYRTKAKWYHRVRDSKTTSEDERADLVEQIKSNCLGFAIGEVSSETIDQINIHQASLLAKKIAVENMLKKFDAANFDSRAAKPLKIFLYIDGRFKIGDLSGENAILGNNISLEQRAVVGGDASILSISAASIIAKVYRDNILKNLDSQFPQFGFAQHKGYNTKQHRQAILQNGITPQHRKSFMKNFEMAQLQVLA